MPVDDTMRKLYEINDTLEALAHQHGVPSRFNSEDDYDRWLNDLTHHVAEEMGVNAPDDETEEIAESHIDYRAQTLNDQLADSRNRPKGTHPHAR